MILVSCDIILVD